MKRSLRTTTSLLVLLALAAGVPTRAQSAQQATWIEKWVPRMAGPEAQLEHARHLKRQTSDKQGDELAFWRKLSVEAYQAVRVFHPGASAICVEAAFRAGEILRAGGDQAGAMEEFGWSIQHGQGSDFRTRARLEMGHLHRRAERWREALESYLDVAADTAALGARREDAWLWAGTAWRALGRVEDARLAWQRVAGQGTDPLARVQGFDELALLCLAESDLEGAAGVLDQCLRALSAHALEETETGERVRNALLRMRIVVELPRAIALRNGSSAEQGSPRKS
ncbi:MAG: hypothetical protein HOP15_06355 [Planctomycetes bacterium]|nr:hypothetical protein [Planctomycetota bacterium]